MKDPWARPVARLRKAAKGLPEVVESTWFDTPSLKVRGKSFVRLKDKDTLVLLMPMEEKELLMEVEPEVFYETDHYKGWPAVLARLARMSPAMLKHHLERSWRQKAPKRLIAEFDAKQPSARRRPKL